MRTKDKEFQAKTLDEAIGAACSYYDLPREKLEIDILSDSKAGIFGLVGAKKARIVARPAPSLESFSMSLKIEDEAQENKEHKSGKQNKRGNRDTSRQRSAAAAQKPSEATEKPQRENGNSGNSEPEQSAVSAPVRDEEPEDGQTAFPSLMADTSLEDARGGVPGRRAPGPRPERGNRSRRERPERGGRERSRREAQPGSGAEPGKEGERRERRPLKRDSRQPREDSNRRNRVLAKAASHEKEAGGEDIETDQHMAYEGLPLIPLAELDSAKLLEVTREAMTRILKLLCPEAGLNVVLGDERVDVSVDSEEAAALLIGREGQTLAAMQYLLTRIVGRAMNAAVNIHLDISAYRQRQDDKLRELSVLLAERARTSGRPQFTRPLSSYHRRIVHMTLQEESDLVTRSKGEGALKRVSVSLK